MKESISYFQLLTKPLKCVLESRKGSYKSTISSHQKNTTVQLRQGSQEKTVSFIRLALMLEETDRLLHLFRQTTTVIIWEFLKTVNTDDDRTL